MSLFFIYLFFLSYLHFKPCEKCFFFQTVGRLIVRDIIFRYRTCLVFCFLGCVVKFQTREALTAGDVRKEPFQFILETSHG